MPKARVTNRQANERLLLGDLGEDLIGIWGKQAGFSVHPSKRDRDGWDALLQFEVEGATAASLPLERRAPFFSCMIQIRALSIDAGRTSIKLSNLFRMVQPTMPWFVVALIIPDRRGSPTRAYVVHVDETIVSLTLKKIRGLPDRARHDLHKRTASVKWGTANLLPRPDGDALRGAILGHIGESQQKYVEWKAHLFDTIGYDPDKFRGQVTFSVDGSHDQQKQALSDFAVGLRDDLPVSSLQLDEVRFGIPRPALRAKRPHQELGLQWRDGHIPSVGATELSLRAGDEEVTLSCQTRSSHAVFPFLPAEFAQLRLVRGAFWLLLGGTPTPRLRWGFRSDPDAEAPVGELGRAGMACRLLATKGVELECRWEGHSIRILRPVPTSVGPIEPVPYVAECAWYLARQFALADSTPVSLAELLPQTEEMLMLRSAFGESALLTSFRFDSDDPDSVIGAPFSVIVLPAVRIGRRSVGAAVMVRGIPEIDPDSREVLISTPEVRIGRKLTKDSTAEVRKALQADLGAQYDLDDPRLAIILPPYGAS